MFILRRTFCNPSAFKSWEYRGMKCHVELTLNSPPPPPKKKKKKIQELMGSWIYTQQTKQKKTVTLPPQKKQN